MYKLRARDMLDWSEDEVWKLEPLQDCSIEFDDVTIEDADVVDVQISWYFWQVIKYYREIPLDSYLYLAGRNFNDGLARDLMNHVVQASRKFDHIDREDVWSIVMRDVYNRCFCAISTRLLPYISGTSSDDNDELLNDPRIKKANENLTDALSSKDEAYAAVEEVFMSDDYPDNPVARSVEYGTVKLKQMLPSFGPIGSRTDIDSEIYRKWVKPGFARGMTSIADFAKESRSAAKALLFNKDPVAMAEYFNRKLQFVAAFIKYLKEGDCGTTDYHTLHIPEGDAGKDMLHSLEGMTKVCDDGTQHPIDPKDLSQLGKPIHFRSTMTCRHLSEGGVCTKCYGDISYSIPKGDNPGHVSCTSVNEKITQLIISTKHLDFIIHNLIVRLNRTEQAYFKVEEKHPDMIYMNPSRKGEKIVMRISKKEAPRLTSLRYIEDTVNMNLTSTTQLSYVTLYRKDTNGILEELADLDMVKRSTKASLSREGLMHVKKTGWEERDGHYYIDLSSFNVKRPLFTYPHRHENMVAFGERVERFIRSARTAGENDRAVKGHVGMLTRYKNVDSALYDAYYLISEKIGGVYMGHLATILAASRAANAKELDYSMPNSLEQGSFQTHDDIIRYRSLGVSMLYQHHSSYFADIDSYIVKDRMSSNLDDLIHLEEDKYPRTAD